MSMTPRMKQMLSILLEEDEIISVANLAQAMQLSKRTVQRELAYLPKALRAHNLEFISKTGAGVWIKGTLEDKKALRAILQGDTVQDVSNRTYRRDKMILELLKDREVKKLFWFSSKFKVSEATISTDLEAIEQWFVRYNLALVRKLGSGVSLEGKEEDTRRAMRAFIEAHIDTALMVEAYHASNAQGLFQQSGIAPLLSAEVLRDVSGALDALAQPQLIRLTEQAYLGLIIHLGIAMQRILAGQTIVADAHWLEKFAADADYIFAQQVAQALAKTFAVEIPPIEITYICLHIKAAKHAKIGTELSNSEALQSNNLTALINDMVYAFDAERAYLLKQDEEFLQGLHAHLQPTIVRLSYDMKIENPVLEEIKQQYAAVFAKCKPVGYVLEEWLAKPVPEAELGFLTMHFCAALVRLEARRENRRVVHIGIVCSSGIGISRLMQSKLTQVFRDGIVLCAYGTRDITPEIIAKEDFLVASTPLRCQELPVVLVTPLLNETDIEAIRLQINRHAYTKAKQTVTQNAQVGFHMVQVLADKIKGLTQQFVQLPLAEDIGFDDALRQAAQHITQDPAGQAEIIAAITEREALSTQVFPEVGFALLHAKVDAVAEPRFCAFTTPAHTPFANPYWGGILVAFIMLAPAQAKSTLDSELLGAISGSLVEENAMLGCVHEGDQEAAKAHLATLLEGFFSRYISTMQNK